jgi:hypothetical protein
MNRNRALFIVLGHACGYNWEVSTPFSQRHVLHLFFLLFVIGGIGGSFVVAQDVSSVVVATEGSGNTELGELLTRSAELELQRLGFRLTEDPTAASHVVDMTYRTQGSRVDLEAAISSTDDNTVLAERSTEAAIDLNLDDAVGVLVRELLDESGTRAATGGTVPSDSERPGGDPTGGSSERTRAQSEPLGELAGVIAVPRDPFFQVSSGFAPFLPLGRVARYAGTGYSPVLSLRRTWVPGRVEVSGGILTGGHNLSMTGAVTQGSNWFIPVGVSFWLSSPTLGQVLAAHLFVSAGGAASILTPDAGEPQQSVLPFVFGGLGVTVPVNSRFGFSMETGYITFFDGAFPISGFLPTLLVNYRL